jgi:hypothetical protein
MSQKEESMIDQIAAPQPRSTRVRAENSNEMPDDQPTRLPVPMVWCTPAASNGEAQNKARNLEEDGSSADPVTMLVKMSPYLHGHVFAHGLQVASPLESINSADTPKDERRRPNETAAGTSQWGRHSNAAHNLPHENETGSEEHRNRLVAVSREDEGARESLAAALLFDRSRQDGHQSQQGVMGSSEYKAQDRQADDGHGNHSATTGAQEEQASYHHPRYHQNRQYGAYQAPSKQHQHSLTGTDHHYEHSQSSASSSGGRTRRSHTTGGGSVKSDMASSSGSSKQVFFFLFSRICFLCVCVCACVGVCVCMCAHA